jgi:hypothetical protein
MKRLFALLFVLSLNAHSEVVPLPPAVASVDEIINEFRNVFVTKINELGKNFISQLSDKTIVFKNSGPLNCNESLISQGEPVASMQYNFKKIENELIEKSIYTGCKNDIALVEDIITRGGALTPLKYSDFIKGKRVFDLNDDEIYRFYRISNAENEEIFKMIIEKNGKNKFVEFSFLGQKFLQMNYLFQENSTNLTLTFYGYKAKYVRKHSRWSTENMFEPFTNNVIVTKGVVNQISYVSSLGTPLSQSEFSSRFDKMVMSGPLSKVRKILDYHNYYFPRTKTVQSGALNKHFNEELQLAFNRIQNNTELNLVKKQIQDYIEAANLGLIIDNRPVE